MCRSHADHFSHVSCVTNVINHVSISCHVSHMSSVNALVTWSCHMLITCLVDLMSVACWPHASPVNCISLVSQLCDSRVNQASVMCYISQSHDHVSLILVMCQSWIACHLSQTCWSHVNRVNHVSVMCWSHVTSLSWVSHVSHVLLTCSCVIYDSITY